jgi:glycerol-3-phosphate dehydrogenase
MLVEADYSAAEIAGIIEREQVECLADLFLRRTTIAITGGLTPDLIDAVLTILAAQKGWDSEQSAAERAAFLGLLAGQHGIHFSDSAQTNDRRSALCA